MSLQCAVEDAGLDYITNIEVLHSTYIEPLRCIAKTAERGGAHRFIARERFREEIEREGSWIDERDFDDIANDEDYHLLDGEPIYWMIWHDGDAPDWTDELQDDVSVLQALLEQPEVQQLYYVNHMLGYIYVFRSPLTTMGRMNHQSAPNQGIHPWTDVVVFSEDHPDFNDTEGPCVSAEILRIAAKYHEEEGLDDE